LHISYLGFRKCGFEVRSPPYLTFTTKPPKEFVCLELVLLVGDDAWHFEVEAGFGWLGLVEPERVKGQHGVVVLGEVVVGKGSKLVVVVRRAEVRH
jgi:hypothetical protein